MKKTFQNYNFNFDKNEKKIINTFCKQVIKQTEGNQDFYAETRAFKSIIEKLNVDGETVKFTKDELIRLKRQFSENIKYLNEQSTKGWFFKKWMYKSMFTQYSLIFNAHFKD
ncbi:MAG: hypothetical protein KF721_13130 [Ignavibacteriaceae bacterium]|nr:hypothetical protein [Ignavibacteriaceae bacterium]HRI46555.1 hypothetical protein [Ignavibacteriaceae bacterium]